MSVYDADAEHLLNRLHHSLFIATLVPEEIQSNLPVERRRLGVADEAAYASGWQFAKRRGERADAGVFGGDIRVSPRRAFDNAERRRLMSILRELDSRADVELIEELRDPMTRLLVQWDVMSVWWFLERAKCDDVTLLEAMAKCVAALSQPAVVLRSLPSGLNELDRFRGDEFGPTEEPFVPADFVLPADAESPWVEVGRKSSVLFKADRTVRASRVFLNAGDPTTTRALIDDAAKVFTGEVTVPPGTLTILIQQMMAIDDQMRPVATPVIDEFRVRVMDGPAELRFDNRSSSRDGSSHWIYLRTRAGTLDPAIADFRFVPDTDQALFLEYGTQKHATFSAQCALCHRRTETGNGNESGIRIFERVAKPFETSPMARMTLAESEMAKVVERLKQRLDPPKADKRPARTAEERAAHAAKLRELYAVDAADWPTPQVDGEVDWTEIGVVPPVVHPANNLASDAKIHLGRILFHDPRLSAGGQMACASCHDPDLGWADGRSVSFGLDRKRLGRNSPSIINSGHRRVLFWDGRASSLEDQAIAVMANHDEMQSSAEGIHALIASSPEYQRRFADAFADFSIDNRSELMRWVAEALACFERTITSGQSKFDSFARGKRERMNDDELIGLDLFRREGRCMNCHHGPLFSDDQFHDLGLSNFGRRFEDLGRYEITHDAEDVGKFRTPSLRNVSRTAPYMHSGLFEFSSLLMLYNTGMPTIRKRGTVSENEGLMPTKSHHLRPLGLNDQDVADLVAFLKTLEEPWRRTDPPELPGDAVKSVDDGPGGSKQPLPGLSGSGNGSK